MPDTVTYVDPYIFRGYYDLFSPRWRLDSLARSALRVVSEPVQEPLSLDEAAQHLNVDAYEEGGSPPAYFNASLISALITASREYIEGLTGCMLAPQQVELGFRDFTSMSCWGEGISLRTGPVTGVISVTYYDTDGNSQVLDPSNYYLDNFVMPARIYLSSGGSWPSALDRPNSIRIVMQAGYDARGASPLDNQVPQSLLAAMKLVLGHLHENREAIVVGTIVSNLPLGVDALIQRYRITDPLA